MKAILLIVLVTLCYLAYTTSAIHTPSDPHDNTLNNAQDSIAKAIKDEENDAAQYAAKEKLEQLKLKEATDAILKNSKTPQQIAAENQKDKDQIEKERIESAKLREEGKALDAQLAKMALERAKMEKRLKELRGNNEEESKGADEVEKINKEVRQFIKGGDKTKEGEFLKGIRAQFEAGFKKTLGDEAERDLQKLHSGVKVTSSSDIILIVSGVVIVIAVLIVAFMSLFANHKKSKNSDFPRSNSVDTEEVGYEVAQENKGLLSGDNL